MGASSDLTGTDTILDYGDRGLLLQFDRTADVLTWTAALRAAGLPGVIDVVPASRTILVELDAPRDQGVTRQRLRKLRPDTGTGAIESAPPGGHPDVLIDVVYDGADLAEVAERTGLTIAQVVEAHTAAPWRVGFNGSAPGFAYLMGGDPRLVVPRRAEPRPEVPAGTVALAGEFTGIYPRRKPGGWQLIGHTEVVLWNPDRPDPVLLTAGRWVQFRAVEP